MEISAKLREHLEKSFGLAKDATDDVAYALIAQKLASKELTKEKMVELSKTDAKAAVTELVSQQVQAANAPILEALTALTKALTPKAPEPPKVTETATIVAQLPSDFDNRMKEMETRFEMRMAERQTGNDGGALMSTFAILKGGIPSNEKDPTNIRVKSAVERFSATTKAATYGRNFGAVEHGGKAGLPVVHNGETIDLPSPRRKAQSAAWFKSQVYPEYLTPHDRDIILWTIHNEKFIIDDVKCASMADFAPPARLLNEKEREECWNAIFMPDHQKALINDSTSGGAQAIPQFFDTDFVFLPVLGNEVAPLLNIRDAPRGQAAHTYSMSVPTFAAATTEGTPISLFTTTSFIGAIDITFFRAAGAIEIGLNFLADATPGIADEIENGYSRKAAEWLDRVTISGDGTTEPQGILNASSTVSVSANTPTNGPWVIADALNLYFGVPKAYRMSYPATNMGYAMTETTYKRFRSIATGVTGDTRLIFGMDIDSYQLFNRRAAVLAAGIGPNNDQVVFAQFGGYRMYRRQGLRFRRETQGQTLALKNTMLICADMRFGGKLDRGSYAAVMQNGMG